MINRKQLIKFIRPKLRRSKKYMSWRELIRNVAERRFSFVILHSFIICSFFQTLSVLVMNPNRIIGFSTILVSLKLFEKVFVTERYFHEFRFVFGVCGVLGRMFLPLSPFICSIIANFSLAQYIFLSFCFNRQKKPGDVSLALGVSLSNAILLIVAYKTVGSTIDITLFTPTYRFFFPIAGIFLLVYLCFQYYALEHCKHGDVEKVDDKETATKIPVNLGVYWYDESPKKSSHFEMRLIILGVFFSLFLFHFIFSSPIIMTYYDLRKSSGYIKIVFIEVITLMIYNAVTTFVPNNYGFFRKWCIRGMNWTAFFVFLVWNYVSEFLNPFYFIMLLIPMFLFNIMFLTHQILRKRLKLESANYSHLFWSLFILYGVILLKIYLRKNWIFLIPHVIIMISLFYLKKVCFVYFNDGVEELSIYEGDGERNYKLRVIANLIGFGVFLLMIINFSSVYLRIRTGIVDRFRKGGKVRVHDEVRFSVFSDENALITYYDERGTEIGDEFDVLVVPNYSVHLETDFQDPVTMISHDLHFDSSVNLEEKKGVDGLLVDKGFAVISKFPIIFSKLGFEEKFLMYKFAVGYHKCLTVLFERKKGDWLNWGIVELENYVVQKTEKLAMVREDFSEVRDQKNEVVSEVSMMSESIRTFVIKMK